MDFGLTDEQRSIVEVTRAFVERELYPHEEEVERTGVLRPELADQIRAKALAAGLYAANMPEEVGGAGLDTVTWVLYEKELGKANYALHYCGVPRPSNILLAGTEAQRESYLYPCVRGEKIDCLAHDRAGRRVRHARHAHPGDPRRRRLADQGHQALHQPRRRGRLRDPGGGDRHRRRRPGRRCRRSSSTSTPRASPCTTATATSRTAATPTRSSTSTTCGSATTRCSARRARASSWPATWLGSTRLQVAASCLGRAERALDLSVRHAATREQFGQPIGKFQGVGFKLADMASELRAAELMTLHAAWKYDQGTATDSDIAMAKLKATEMLAMVADEAIQIHGGMGLMDELPLERIWRDARIERIWDGTSEIQRHIISRSLLRPLGA